MRPEISRLLVPSIYAELLDHQSVANRPSIRGVTSNVFFVTHQEKELAVSKMLYQSSKTKRVATYLFNTYHIDAVTAYTQR